VNRIDQETEEEATAHKVCRAIQEEEEDILNHYLPSKAQLIGRIETSSRYRIINKC
jgi:hypothetical protein